MKFPFLLFIIFSLFTSSLFAQDEVLIFQQKKIDNVKKSFLKSGVNDVDTPVHYILNLPFYDDFAKPGPFPNEENWVDNYAFINTGFARNIPVTIGTATLDALGSDGLLYPNAKPSSFMADRLTSQPLNLKTYMHTYRSNELYKTASEQFPLKDTLYFYNKILKDTVSVSLGYMITAADTLYTLNEITNTYEVYQDALFYKVQGKNEYDSFSVMYSDSLYEYNLNDTIMMSFLYQAGGIADMPEETDILLVQFYAPADVEGVFINEITKNEIEIYNSTDFLLNLKGYFIGTSTDKSMLTGTNKISEDVFISPYRFTTLDMVALTGEDSVRNLYLFDVDTILVDSLVTNLNFSEEFSVGRIPDGNNSLQVITQQTLGDINPNWVTVDSIVAYNNSFNTRRIQILKSTYLRKGFRFRFVNYASLSNDESHARNEDMWNIDDVWIDAWRGDATFAPDVSFISGIGTMLDNDLKAIPTSHLTNANKEFNMNVRYNVVSKDSIERRLYSFFEVSHNNESNTKKVYSIFEQDVSDTVPSYDILNNFRDYNIDYDQYIDTTLEEGYNEYTFKQYFTNYAGISEYNRAFRWNDTVRSTLIFDNFYAYDDGTAEAGYGLRESKDARCAVKYIMEVGDTLQGVDIFFNNTLYNKSINYSLCVWREGDDGMPGEMIAQKFGLVVEYNTSLNSFKRILFEKEDLTGDNESLFIEEGETYFVGWKQTQDVLINIGVDLNSPVRDKIYYNTSFQWFESSKDVALMIRPLVGDKPEMPSSTERHLDDNFGFVVYPNPAYDIVYVETNDDAIKSITLYSILGTEILKCFYTNSFSVADIPEGMYMLVAETENGVSSKRLLVK